MTPKSNLIGTEFNLKTAIKKVAESLSLKEQQVESVVQLLDAGNTIPFIARYRKEATQGLDEIALRAIEDAMEYSRELHARKQTVLKSIDEQGLLTEDLHRKVISCEDLQILEAIYLPYKPKRKTRASVAKEKGLQPLADILLLQRSLGQSKQELLRRFVNKALDVPDEQSALQGAMDIVAEKWADDPETRIWLTEQAMKNGRIVSQVKRGKKDEAAKFEMYANHCESVSKIPSHRFLAMKRGETEGILKIGIELEADRYIGQIKSHFVLNPRFEFYSELLETVEDCFERLLMPAVESASMQLLKERSDEDAIAVFAKNLRELLLAPPAGPKVTLGVDPGFRTGCKLAVVDGTGKYLSNATIYPTPPTNDTSSATDLVLGLVARYRIELIAIGNGTASRETDSFFSDLIKKHSLAITKVMVSESGASIYSASELAAREYPSLDVTVRGAISIAHRLQDPLAELVKSDPKTIGVGQYQHDVNQSQLRKCLEREVESCVNSVGVDLNLASAALLSYVSGIGPKLAERIVEFRDTTGRFRNRKQLLKVPKLGAKAFEQSAGFLRISDGDYPLDNSAVHPESYPVVEKMAQRLKISMESLVGNSHVLQSVKPEEFVDKTGSETLGLPTIIDILHELKKPGRDPRKEFRTVQFTEGINKIEDLQIGMVLDGIVTNVTHFGAFVDIGVHQDALIHISQLSNTYVKDPNEVVSVGDLAKIKIIDIDIPRKRISVTKKL